MPKQMVKGKITEQKGKQKYYYDKQTKELPQLQVGDKIRTQNSKNWGPATVTNICNGQVFRRNRLPQVITSKERSRIHSSPPQMITSEDESSGKDSEEPGKEHPYQTDENDVISTQRKDEDDILSGNQEAKKTSQNSTVDEQPTLRCSTRTRRRPDYYIES